MSKNIVIIDGGPRKMNTSAMAEAFSEGVSSMNANIAVRKHRLYELDYKGCVSCLACKLKGKSSRICMHKDGLSDVLKEVSHADGLVCASPIYMGEFTAQMRAFFEGLLHT